MKTLLFVLLAWLVGSAAAQIENTGNVKVIAKILKSSLTNATCEEKTVVVEKFLDGDFDYIIQKYHTPKPNFGGQEPLVRIFMRRIKQKTANFSCDQKAELLDATIDMDIAEVRRLINKKGKKTVENWGNLQTVAKVLEEAVEGQDCETKSKVLKSLIQGEYNNLKVQYKIPIPNFGNMKGMIKNVAHLVDSKYSKIPCQMKAQLLDLALSGKFASIKQLMQDKVTPGIQALTKLVVQLQKATSHMNCNDKIEVFDTVLAGDWLDLKYLGIDKPQFGQAEERLYKIARKVAHQVQGMACQEKAKIFDLMIKGKGMLNQAMQPDKINNFITEVKKAYKNIPCQEKSKIIDLVLNGKYKEVAEILRKVAPIEIPVQIPTSMLKFVHSVKGKMKFMKCEDKVKAFEKLLGGQVNQVANKVQAKQAAGQVNHVLNKAQANQPAGQVNHVVNKAQANQPAGQVNHVVNKAQANQPAGQVNHDVNKAQANHPAGQVNHVVNKAQANQPAGQVNHVVNKAQAKR